MLSVGTKCFVTSKCGRSPHHGAVGKRASCLHVDDNTVSIHYTVAAALLCDRACPEILPSLLAYFARQTIAKELTGAAEDVLEPMTDRTQLSDMRTCAQAR